MITDNRQITEHFHSTEFICQHCGQIKIEEELVNKLESLFAKLNASKCIISNGYRCRDYDIQIGGFAGKHSEGLASDCVYYDENGNIIPSKIVICVAWDMKLLNGIANIDGRYVHLDNRKNGTYYGDEQVSNNSCWSNPYQYFGVSKEDVVKYTHEEIKNDDVNVEYCVKTVKHGWLPVVRNLEDYAGFENSPIIGLAIKVDRGSIKYRVHSKNGYWMPFVTEFNLNDYINGYAGDDTEIDEVEIYYFTPDDIRPFKRAKYKVNDYDWQFDNEKGNGQDGYAGVYGVTATKVQIVIE